MTLGIHRIHRPHALVLICACLFAQACEIQGTVLRPGPGNGDGAANDEDVFNGLDRDTGGSHVGPDGAGEIQTQLDAGLGDSGPAAPIIPEHGTGSFVQVNAGATHACGLKSNKEMACWGSNFAGESSYDTPGRFKQVVAGNAFCTTVAGRAQFPAQGGFSCALRDTNDVTCWGEQTTGIGNTPQEKLQQISAGAFPCGLREDGRAVCWGAAPTPPPDVFTQISVGGAGTVCGLKESGVVLCWGVDLGPVPAGSFKHISVGANFACGLKADTSLACWPSTAVGTAVPTGEGFSAVSVGANHACALRRGVVTCWGANDWLQSEVPDVRFSSVSAGGNHTCAIEPNGGLMCWGMVRVSSQKFTRLSASGQNICAIGVDGLVSCWGHTYRFAGIPPRVQFKEVSTAYNTACGIEINGKLNCWGQGFGSLLRQLPSVLPSGNFIRLDLASLGTFDPYLSAIRADGTLAAWKSSDSVLPGLPKFPSSSSFKDVIVDDRFLCGLAKDGSVGCWDHLGALAAPAGTFVQLESQWFSRKACAVASDGRVVCWSPYNVLETTQVPGNFVEIAFGNSHGCGRSANGKITCWGDDTKGQSNPPNATFARISAGYNHSCALDVEQRAWCWGDYVLRPM